MNRIEFRTDFSITEGNVHPKFLKGEFNGNNAYFRLLEGGNRDMYEFLIGLNLPGVMKVYGFVKKGKDEYVVMEPFHCTFQSHLQGMRRRLFTKRRTGEYDMLPVLKDLTMNIKEAIYHLENSSFRVTSLNLSEIFLCKNGDQYVVKLFNIAKVTSAFTGDRIGNIKLFLDMVSEMFIGMVKSKDVEELCNGSWSNWNDIFGHPAYMSVWEKIHLILNASILDNRILDGCVGKWTLDNNFRTHFRVDDSYDEAKFSTVITFLRNTIEHYPPRDNANPNPCGADKCEFVLRVQEMWPDLWTTLYHLGR